MYGKEGFLRTLEAIISIVLLLGLILYILSGSAKIIPRTPDVVTDTNDYIINEFLNNPAYRKCFALATSGECDKALSDTPPENCKTNIINFVQKAMPPGYTYSCEVCQSSKSCTTINALK
ncbi:MAG: hypothetical protein AABY22_24825, partial [Nanoarchaeota archaeon]